MNFIIRFLSKTRTRHDDDQVSNEIMIISSNHDGNTYCLVGDRIIGTEVNFLRTILDN